MIFPFQIMITRHEHRQRTAMNYLLIRNEQTRQNKKRKRELSFLKLQIETDKLVNTSH